MIWEPYIKAGWQMVMESEGKTQIFLREELEAYLVHMIARSIANPAIPPDIICTQFITATTAHDFRDIGDSCLFVDAWDVKRAKLVEKQYYENLGMLAYEYASQRSNTDTALFKTVARNFRFLSRVLRHVKR